MTKETRAEYAARHRAEAASSRPVRITAVVADLSRLSRNAKPRS